MVESYDSVYAAQTELGAVEAFFDEFSDELTELEAALAHSQPELAGTASAAPFEAINAQLAEFLSSLKSNAHVDPVHVAQE